MAAIGSVRTSAYLLALLAGSALLAAYFYVGPFGSDDLQYVQLAVGGQPSLGTARYAVSGYYLFWARWTARGGQVSLMTTAQRPRSHRSKERQSWR